MEADDDLARLGEIAARNSETIMARAGRLPLASYIMTDTGVRMLIAGAHDDLNTRMFAAVTTVAGARHRARCTAVVMETRMVARRTPEDRAAVEDIRERGGFDLGSPVGGRSCDRGVKRWRPAGRA